MRHCTVTFYLLFCCHFVMLLIYYNCIYIKYVCVYKIYTQAAKKGVPKLFDSDVFMTIWSMFRSVHTSFVMRHLYSHLLQVPFFCHLSNFDSITISRESVLFGRKSFSVFYVLVDNKHARFKKNTFILHFNSKLVACSIKLSVTVL